MDHSYTQHTSAIHATQWHLCKQQLLLHSLTQVETAPWLYDQPVNATMSKRQDCTRAVKHAIANRALAMTACWLPLRWRCCTRQPDANDATPTISTTSTYAENRPCCWLPAAAAQVAAAAASASLLPLWPCQPGPAGAAGRGR